jgi:hypothetical protein
MGGISGKHISLFLFPHQDDEVGVLQSLIEEQNLGGKVFCFYLTRSPDSGISKKRNKESSLVLKKIGIKEENIYFVGDILDIIDGSLIYRLEDLLKWISDWLSIISSLDIRLFAPAWEGGHPDHDATNCLAFVLNKKNTDIQDAWQFPLYNSFKCPGPFFRVLSPLLTNGEAISKRIPIFNRIKFLKICLSYGSQYKTWVGLFPFFFFHYLKSGQEILQPIDHNFKFNKPHSGKLYYEKRGFASWAEVNKHIALFIKK